MGAETEVAGLASPDSRPDVVGQGAHEPGRRCLPTGPQESVGSPANGRPGLASVFLKHPCYSCDFTWYDRGI